MTTSGRLPVLDGLRGVSAICVLLLHALLILEREAPMPHAHLAVDFFFMLSAFVIARAYHERIADGMTRLNFVRVRWIRLYPLHVCGSLFGLAVFLSKQWSSGGELNVGLLLRTVVSALFFLPTWASLAPGWPAGFPLNNPAWSLTFEVVANLFWVLVLIRLSSRVRLLLLAVAAIADVAQAWVGGGITGGATSSSLLMGLVRVAYPFLAGLVLWGWDRSRHRPYPARPPSMRGVLAVMAGLVTIFMMPVALDGTNRALYESAVVIGAFPLILTAALRMTVPMRWAGVLDWLGRVSYPVYILHFPLLRVFSNVTIRHWVNDTWLPVLAFGEVVAVLCVSHWVMTRWDEPLRGWLTRRMLQRPAHDPA